MKYKLIIVTIAIISITLKLHAQTDSLNNRLIYSWELNSLNFEEKLISIDTTLKSFQNYNVLLKNGYSLNYLGNLGSAVQSNYYFDREKLSTGFIFSSPYSIYFHKADKQKFYNTKRQFTVVSYSNAGPKNESEQTLDVLHTQNITKNLNFSIDYDMISSDGRYLNQQVKHNNLAVSSNYKNKRYSAYGILTFNRVKAQENGGIDSLSYLGSDNYSNRKNIPVKLEDASTHVYSTNIRLINEYKFGKTSQELNITKRSVNKRVRNVSTIDKEIDFNSNKPDSQDLEILEKDINEFADSIVYDSSYVNVVKFSGFNISHEFIYDRDVRKYFDNTIESDSFYNEFNIYMDSIKTYDKIYQTRVANKLSLNYERGFNNLSLYIYNEQMGYSYIEPLLVNLIDKDSIVKKTINEEEFNTSLGGIISGHIEKVDYFVFGEYFFLGRKKGDSKLKLDLSYAININSRLGLGAKYVNKNPDFYYENYSSNHIKWNNYYLRMEESWDLKLYMENSSWNTGVNFNYGQVTNYFYFDESATLNQNRGQIRVLSGEIYKDINWGLLHSKTKFLYQYNEDSLISVPDYSLYQSLYLERMFHFHSTGGKLLMQLGIDYRYMSSYLADNYMPITGVFYKQNRIKQDDYHRMDVFINFNIRRASLFLRYDYINSAISKNYYFNAPYYPSPQPLFKFGVTWLFYD